MSLRYFLATRFSRISRALLRWSPVYVVVGVLSAILLCPTQTTRVNIFKNYFDVEKTSAIQFDYDGMRDGIVLTGHPFQHNGRWQGSIISLHNRSGSEIMIHLTGTAGNEVTFDGPMLLSNEGQDILIQVTSPKEIQGTWSIAISFEPIGP